LGRRSGLVVGVGAGDGAAGIDGSRVEPAADVGARCGRGRGVATGTNGGGGARTPDVALDGPLFAIGGARAITGRMGAACVDAAAAGSQVVDVADGVGTVECGARGWAVRAVACGDDD